LLHERPKKPRARKQLSSKLGITKPRVPRCKLSGGINKRRA